MKRSLGGRSVFIDTSALLALINSDDALHQRAVRVQNELDARRSPLVTSEWVFAEFLNHTATPPRRGVGIRAVQALLQLDRLIVEPTTRAAWAVTFERYRTRPDQSWSFVDCSSMLICEDLGIRRVFTHDRHFKQAGFQVLL